MKDFTFRSFSIKTFFICGCFLGIILLLEGCKPPRCKIPGCYVRMLHRHTVSGGEAVSRPASFDPSVGADPEANLGKVYRGVPWWKKNKNPKIGEGYKPGYKYEYRKRKFKPKKEKKDKREDSTVEGKQPVDADAPVENNSPTEKKSRKERKAEKKKQKEQEIKVVDPTQTEKEDGF